MSNIENVIIIGSGPAGYTAAVYTARAELSPLMIEGKQPGGQLMQTTEVENFPGFPDGLMGPELMSQFKKQAERFKTRFVADNITKVDFSSQPFKLWTEDQEYQTKAVIISTGASARWLGIPGEEELKGKGVSACATCDGFFFKNKEVIVVGGGDSAMEEANFLTKFASKIYILIRKDAAKASKIMLKRAENNPKIEIMYNTEATEVLGKDKVEGVKIINNKTQEESVMKVEGLFAAIGHKPNTEIFKDQMELDKKGYIVVEPGTSKTSVAGVFAGGDVADYTYRQAITAAGTGCQAALDAERFLAHKE